MNAPVSLGLLPDHFTRLMQVTAPAETDLVVVIEAYFDESHTHDGAHALTVAGLIFRPGDAAAMHAEWQKVLQNYGLSHFHMTDCAHGNGEFRRFSRDERIQIEMEMLELMYKYVASMLAMSIREQDFAAWFPGRPTFMGDNAYSLGCWSCLIGVRHWAFMEGASGNLALFFESGAKHEKNARLTMEGVCALESSHSPFSAVSYSFIPKKISGPVQAADLWAWLHGKYVNDQLSGSDRVRADYKAVLERIGAQIFIANRETMATQIQQFWHLRYPFLSMGAPVRGRFSGFGIIR